MLVFAMMIAPASRRASSGGLVGRHKSLKASAPPVVACRSLVDGVFQRDRDAVQRSAYFSLRALAIARVGLVERSRVSVMMAFSRSSYSNAIEITAGRCARGDASLRHRGLHLEMSLHDRECRLLGRARPLKRDHR